MATRRRFLQKSAAFAVSAFALCHGRSARSVPGRLDTVRLSDHMLVAIGPDANSLAADTGDGIVLIDGGRSGWSDALLESVESVFSGKPVSTLFNTHWHPEQTGSNVTLGMQGAQIIAHENTKLWLGTEVSLPWSDETYPALPPAGIPTSTFYESGSTRLSGRLVDYRYLLNAHTDGDICVLFPEDNVLVTGGAVCNAGWPLVDWWTGGWIGGMLDAYDVMLDWADEQTKIVPSVGPIMSLAELRSQREMYLAIFDRLQAMLVKSYGTDEVLAARPTAEYDARWGESEQFVTLAFHSLWGHLRDAYDTRLKNIP